MKLQSYYLPALSFGFAFVLALAWPDGKDAPDRARQTAAPTAGPSIRAPREPSEADRIRSALRAGDLETARAIFRELSERDPVAFFELLSRFPGLPEMEGIIKDASTRLPWDRPEITVLLNGIGPWEWRDLAWEAYTAARVGLLPDEEVFEVGTRSNWIRHCSGIRTLLEDAAEKRPDAFWDFLNRKGGTSLREEFFQAFLKHHPERASEFFHRIPDGDGANYDRAYVLQARSYTVPTVESLASTLEDLGPRGIYSATFAGMFTGHVYNHATEAEREKVLEMIAEQPPLARNRMISHILSDSAERPAEEFSRLLSYSTSGWQQREALDYWMKEQESLNSGERGWVDLLPTEKLRARANELLDQRADSSGE